MSTTTTCTMLSQTFNLPTGATMRVQSSIYQLVLGSYARPQCIQLLVHSLACCPPYHARPIFNLPTGWCLARTRYERPQSNSCTRSLSSISYRITRTTLPFPEGSFHGPICRSFQTRCGTHCRRSSYPKQGDVLLLVAFNPRGTASTVSLATKDLL